MSSLWTSARHLTRFHTMACSTNCLSVVLMTLHCSVVLEGEHSHSVPVTSGIPQGSVLGPLMFLIFVNDLPCYVKSRVRLFADDTVIYLTIKSESDCRQLQDDLHSLEKWESDWFMEFNPSKCMQRYTGNTQMYTFKISVRTSWQGPGNC